MAERCNPLLQIFQAAPNSGKNCRHGNRKSPSQRLRFKNARRVKRSAILDGVRWPSSKCDVVDPVLRWASAISCRATIISTPIRPNRQMDAVGQISNLMSADHKNQITQIVSELGARLSRFIRARVRTEADAEDVLQDVWQRLITALDAGAVEQIGAWLYTVARNRIIDRARKPGMASLDALAS